MERILDKALQLGLDRKATLIALGGGNIEDMIPTTVMVMVDSSVGGKTGVNHALGKNMFGAFHQPQCVL